MSHIVLKLGGTALSDGDAFKHAKSLALANDSYRILVPSAPAGNGWRMTELLRQLERTEERWIIYSKLEDVLREISRSLSLVNASENWIASQVMLLSQHVDSDDVDWNYVISRGEFWSGALLAETLGVPLVAPTNLIKFKRTGSYDERETRRAFKSAALPERFVMPGFYGADSEGRIRLFPRNGSDISAAIVAAETRAAELHIARKNTPGIYTMNPEIYDGSPNSFGIIDYMSHAHAREMTYRSDSGALHPLALVPLSRAGVTVRVFDVNRPEKPGTHIVPEGHPKLPKRRKILGIAERAGFTVFTLTSPGLNERKNFMDRVARVLKDHRLGYEHEATGVDHVSIVIRNDALRSRQEEVARCLRRVCKAAVSVRTNEGSICLVGHDLGTSLVDIGYLLIALANQCGNCHEEPGSEVRLSFLSMTAAGTSIVIGVPADTLRKAANRLYAELVRKR